LTSTEEDAEPSPRNELVFPVRFTSSATNFLLVFVASFYVPLILAPLFIIPLDRTTALLMIGLMIAFACGIYVYKVAPMNKKAGTLVLSPGDFRIESRKMNPLALSAEGMKELDEKTLRFSPTVLFETKIYFESERDCSLALDSLKMYR